MKVNHCDICRQEFKDGLKLKGIKKGLPWKRSYYICDKCEYVLKRVVLSYRKTKPNWINDPR